MSALEAYQREDAYAAFMMDHAVGSLSQALSLAGDLHVRLSSSGALSAHEWSVIGGALFERFEAGDEVKSKTRRRAPLSTSADALLSVDPSQLKWRRGLSGVAYASTGVPGARFMKLTEGQSAPVHGHKHIEATVVLEGAFEDGRGCYRRGDLVVAAEGDKHAPRAVDGECVCFVARDRAGLWII